MGKENKTNKSKSLFRKILRFSLYLFIALIGLGSVYAYWTFADIEAPDVSDFEMPEVDDSAEGNGWQHVQELAEMGLWKGEEERG